MKKSMENNKKELLLSLRDLAIALIRLIGAFALLVLAVKYLLS